MTDDMVRTEGEAGRLLEDDILQTLKDKGYKTLDEFVERGFTGTEIEKDFLVSGLLSHKQCRDLKKAVGKHRATRPTLQVTSRREVEGHGRHAVGDDELNEQFSRRLSTEAVSQDMIRKEGEAGRLLGDYILQTLKDQGFKTLDEFVARGFTDKDIENYFLTSGLLSPKQCRDLQKAVDKHRATRPTLQVTSRREVEGHGRHVVGDDELDEQFSRRLSTEAVSQDMIRKEGEAGRLLGDYILQTLKDQGFKTLDDFVARGFTDKDIENYFLTSGLLSPKQCRDLQKAVDKHRATRPTLQVTSRQEVQARGHRGLNEQFSGMSTEAVSQEDTVRLLLLGKTGTGKSTTGNTILGQKHFHTSPSFDSVTSDCERHVKTRGNTRIEIMDSPGLFDTSKTNNEICTIIIQSVAGMHPGPHAILYVTKPVRYTEEEHAAYGRFKALFNDDVTKYVIIVFTHGDLLERQGTTLAAMLSSPTAPANLKQVIQECGNRYILFNNESHDKQTQVDELLKMVRKMTAENGDRPYTCPKYSNIGEGLEEEVNKRMAKYEERELQRNKYVQGLKAETKEAEQKVAETRKEFDRKEAQREEEARKEAEKNKKLEQEMNKRMAEYEERELQRNKHVQDLTAQIKETEQKQAEAQKEFERKEAQRKEETKKEAEKKKKLEQEMNKRMAEYEERELQRNKYFQNQIEEMKQKAEKIREEFEGKEAQREEEIRKEIEKLEQAKKNQHAILETDKQRQQKELDELRQHIAKQKQEDQERTKKTEKHLEEQKIILKQELAEMKKKERQIQEQVEQQRREEEQRRKAERKELKRLEQERMKILEQQEKKRRKDMEEMERRDRELEERMAREREAEREKEHRRERERQREMEELKSRVAENNEPGFFRKVWNGVKRTVSSVVSSVVSAISNWFS